MTTMVEGLYKQGKIELTEPPAGWPDGPVRVLLIGPGPTMPPRMLTFGCLASGDTSTLEDFEYPDAEWQKEWDAADGQ